MPITPEHAFKEKSTKLLILPSLRTSYNRTFQCETPCRNLNFQYNKFGTFECSKRLSNSPLLYLPNFYQLKCDFGNLIKKNKI